jgi:hypothetical protein
MKIVVYACCQDNPQGLFQRARITTYVGLGSAPFPMEYFAETAVDFLPDSVPHKSCSHSVTLEPRMPEEVENNLEQLSLRFN